MPSPHGNHACAASVREVRRLRLLIGDLRWAVGRTATMIVAVIQMLPDLAADADGLSALGPLFASVELKAPMPAHFSVLKFSLWPKAFQNKTFLLHCSNSAPKHFTSFFKHNGLHVMPGRAHLSWPPLPDVHEVQRASQELSNVRNDSTHFAGSCPDSLVK